MLQFEPWPKIARLNRDIIITEKIDGTNACVAIVPAGDLQRPMVGTNVTLGHDGCGEYWSPVGDYLPGVLTDSREGPVVVYAQSRKRIITPEADNFGFARWVRTYAEELAYGLGPGHHFGEWYGSGIQRTYGLDHKRFALFNSARWGRASSEFVPDCCEVVPELYVGPFSQREIELRVAGLRTFGSSAVPGYMNPEGIIVWHTAARTSFKVTLVGDSEYKNQS